LFYLTAATIPVYSQSLSPRDLANGTVHIVAVMVEFQQDDNRFTSGDGRFNPSYLDRDDIFIDPLPHDRGYFEAHLTFAQNYFQKASAGRLQLTFEVLPQIVTLPQEMSAYSPLGEDGAENHKLGLLARDTWSEVARMGILAARPFDPDRTMYIIFHAGAGRDLELTGTSLTKTPQDIPSVFLSEDALQRLLNDPNFPGFDVGNGTPVRNTAILPETQSRPGTDILGNDFVLELSINGIITANIGSFLGLPDLFNTTTGQSGIGRFGLMDGAGFFSYFGLFPPAPSAWERYFLGWADPVDITPVVRSGGEVTLNAAISPSAGTIAKYPISSDEYFLVENRIREYPAGDGLTVTMRQTDGTISTHTIARDETRFDPFDLRKIGEILPAGVLIDVSHFDWSLPGGLDVGADRISGTADDRFLNGGVLIWHIDEQIISAGIADNTVNSNPSRRGVRLVEADAAQDIGRPAGGVTQYEQGSAFDFWWSGNDFTVITLTGQRLVLYQNRFADDTRPNNRSNTGARTNFEFFDFSDVGQTMTFQAKTTTPGDIQPLELPFVRLNGTAGQSRDQFQSYPLSLIVTRVAGTEYLIIPHNNGVHLVNLDSQSGFQKNITFEAPHQPLLFGDGFLLASSGVADPASTGVVQYFNALPPSADATYSATWSRSGFQSIGLPAAESGPDSGAHLQRTPHRLRLTDGVSLPAYSESVQFTGYPAGNNTLRGILSARGLSVGNALNTGEVPVLNLRAREFSGKRLYAMSANGPQSNISRLIFWSDERLVVLQVPADNPAQSTLQFETELTNASWPVFSDWNNDGESEMFWVNTQDNTLEVRHLTGAFADGFPIQAPDGFEFTGAPIVLPSDAQNPGILTVMASDAHNYVMLVYTSDNLRQPTEILLVGPKRPGLHPLQPVMHEGRLYAVSPAGDLRAWQIGLRSDSPSFYLYGDPRSNILRITDNLPQLQNGDLLVSVETYNWPNPARDHTFLRFQTTRDSDISVTITGYDGAVVRELRASSRGGVSGELFLDTSGWGNGVYFARISARSEGTTAHKLITMVVIR
jgi:hypothetical protein